MALLSGIVADDDVSGMRATIPAAGCIIYFSGIEYLARGEAGSQTA